jgi:uncharacterized protein (TIGR02284 family)
MAKDKPYPHDNPPDALPEAPSPHVNMAGEDAYWRERFAREAYYRAPLAYEDYRPAYELGWTHRELHDHDFDTLEPGLAAEWASRRGASGLDWNEARLATRAAWDRADRTYFQSIASEEGDPTVDVLNELLEIARDGEYGFRTCAEQVINMHLRQFLGERSMEWRRAGEELIRWIVRQGGMPAEGGTASGAIHRGWVSLKGAFGANSDGSILEECERAEDVALARCREALARDAVASEVRHQIERQVQGAQRSHARIRQLRDQAGAAA